MDVQEKQYEKLGVVVCYFNPSNYISKFVNFLDFYYKIKNNTNICLQIVESYSNDSVYPLKNTISKNIISINIIMAQSNSYTKKLYDFLEKYRVKRG